MRRVLAAVLLVLAGCGHQPNSLFDAAGYHVRDGAVYYLNAFPGSAFQIEGADVDSFEVLDAAYARDRHTVYLDGRRLPDADPITFAVLARPGYAKDARHIFVRDRILSTDPAHFQLLGGELAKDSGAVYWSDGTVLSHDPQHFVIVSDTDHYLFAKDGANVYVNGNTIAGADPPSLRVLGGAYATDRDRVYYFSDAIVGADRASLRFLQDAYAADDRRAYWMGKEIPGADPGSFRVLNGAFECTADADRAYYRQQVIAGADPRTFPANRQVIGCSAAEISFTN